jgi:hypothetical protein
MPNVSPGRGGLGYRFLKITERRRRGTKDGRRVIVNQSQAYEMHNETRSLTVALPYWEPRARLPVLPYNDWGACIR